MDPVVTIFVGALALFMLLAGYWAGERAQAKRSRRDHVASLRVAAEVVRTNRTSDHEALAQHIEVAAKFIETRSL